MHLLEICVTKLLYCKEPDNIKRTPQSPNSRNASAPPPHWSRHCPLQHSHNLHVFARPFCNSHLLLFANHLTKTVFRRADRHPRHLLVHQFPFLRARLLRTVLWDYRAHFGPEDGGRKLHRNLGNTGHCHSVQKSQS